MVLKMSSCMVWMARPFSLPRAVKLGKGYVQAVQLGQHDHGEIFAQNALRDLANVGAVLGANGAYAGDDTNGVLTRYGDYSFHDGFSFGV